MSTEPLSFGKFFSGLVSVKTGVKALAFLPWLLVFIFIGYLIWHTFLKKPQPTQDINVESGGTVEIHNEAPKKSIYWFVEPWIGKANENKWNSGIRTGMRYEFP